MNEYKRKHPHEVLMQTMALAVCICFFALFYTCQVYAKSTALTQKEIDTKISSLKEKYPNYSTWTGSYAGGKQCWGFARLIADAVFGGSSSTEWKKLSSISNVKTGDILQYGNTSGSGHTVFVTKVSGSTITFVDCNGNGNYTNGQKVRDCGIKWGNTISTSAKMFGKYSFSYLLSSPGIIPSKPINLTWSAPDKNKITIEWKKVDGAASYTVWRRKKIPNGTSEYKKISDVTDTSFQDTELEAATIYYYKVTAVNGTVSSEKSDACRTWTWSKKPSVTALGPTSVKISWDEIQFAETYTIERRLAGDNQKYAPIKTGLKSTEFIDTGVQPNTSYYYRIYPVANADNDNITVRSETSNKVTTPKPRHAIDLNCVLDGKEYWDLAGCGTVDIWVDGKQVAFDDKDYWGEWEEGSTFEINDVKTNFGYKFEGIRGGSMSGTVGGSDVDLRLIFTSIPKYEATPGEQCMPDGWYMLASGNDNDWVLDVNGWHGENGTNLELYHRNNTTNQRFYLHYLGNGFYSIQAQHSGKYIHKQDEALISNVHQWEGFDSKNAQWKLVPAEDGYFYLEARSGGYLDNSNGRTTEANNIGVCGYNGSDAQKWRFVSTNTTEKEVQTFEDGWYTIEIKTAGNLALDVSGFSQENGANVLIWTANKLDNQQFYVQYRGEGYYTISPKHSGKYLSAAGSDGQYVNVCQTDTMDKNSLWCIEPAGDGSYLVRCKNGNYLDNSSDRAEPGNNVGLYLLIDGIGGPAQRWKFIPYNGEMPDPRIVSSFNGHTYEYYEVYMTWREAKEFCEKKGGHLVTITSHGENDFVSSLVAEGWMMTEGWIGASDMDKEGAFIWATGEPFSYSNWSPNEPNNGGDAENAVEILRDGQWNDNNENLSLPFVCEYGVDDPAKTASFNGRTYERYDVPMTWQEAKNFCEAKGGHLVTISSKGENDFVSGLMTEGWIGAADIDNEGSFSWVTGEPFSYSNWMASEPNNAGDNENCAEIREGGQWNDYEESRTLPFVCEYGVISPVKSETFGNHTYEYYDMPMTWQEAKNFCEAKGGYLATVTSQEENDLLGGFQSEGWIGANDMDGDGNFVWITGEPLGFSNWMEGEPNNAGGKENVVEMRSDGQWNDYREGEVLPFFCEYGQKRISISDCEITLSESSFTYDGTEKKPSVTVKHDGTVLKEGEDYSVSYRDNVEVGEASVTIVGKGDFAGTVKKKFNIMEAETPDPTPTPTPTPDPEPNGSGKVSAASVEVAAGKTVAVPIMLDENPGIIGINVLMGYDADRLRLVKVEAGEILDGSSMSGNYSKNPYKLSLSNETSADNIEGTGVLATAYFELLEGFDEGKAPVSLTFEEAYDKALNDVAFRTEDGKVSIRVFIPGDVNRDGQVKLNDAIQLRRYVAGWDVDIDLQAADVNRDDHVKLNDAIILRRYVAGWDLELK